MQNPLFVKFIVVVCLLVIIGSLTSGLVAMINGRGRSDRMAKALTVRIAVSVALFVLLVVGVLTGFVAPHGIAP